MNVLISLKRLPESRNGHPVYQDGNGVKYEAVPRSLTNEDIRDRVGHVATLVPFGKNISYAGNASAGTNPAVQSEGVVVLSKAYPIAK